MAGFPEYDNYDALGLGELVKKGQVKAEELLDEAILRRDAINPRINAVVTNMDDEARRVLRAGPPDGPFKGVPFLLKDLLSAYAGFPMSSGSRAYRNYRPDYDSEMVKRYKAAGLVVFGKANTPEFGIVGCTEPVLFGTTRNPWNPDRTAGGSSGGSAAAVAAGIVPMASGGDGGGSLRIPGSCCALVGFKASRGRNPYGPIYGDPWYGQVQEGVLSRSVRDVAAALDATHGPDVGAPYAAPPPQRPFLTEVGAAPGKLKIAYTAKPLMRGGKLDPECVRALEQTVDFLRLLGHEMVEAPPPHDVDVLAKGYLMRGAAAAAGDVREAAQFLGRRLHPDELEPETWALARLGDAFTAADLDSANRAVLYQSRIFARYMEGYDAFLTPTLAKPPVPHGEFKAKGVEKILANFLRHVGLGRLPRHLPVLKMLAEEKFQWVAATPVMNVTGQPSMSLPLCWSNDNLPIGMMFTARMYDEATLFRLAGQLEKERPWKDKRPPVHANTHAHA